MPNNSAKPRFIAGAVCPRCRLIDKIVVFKRDGIDIRRCVSCEFEEEKTVLNNAAELPTRVNQQQRSKSATAKDTNKQYSRVRLIEETVNKEANGRDAKGREAKETK